MKQLTDTLKSFDLTWGWIIRWVLMLMVAVLVMTADGRYFKREEIEPAMLKLHQMRQEDMAAIYNRIEAVRLEAMTSDRIVRSLEGKIASLEAQIRANGEAQRMLIDQIKELRDLMGRMHKP